MSGADYRLTDAMHTLMNAALMNLKNATLLKFMYDELIPRPKIRNKAAYASAIADHFNSSEIRVELCRGELTTDVRHWHK